MRESSIGGGLVWLHRVTAAGGSQFYEKKSINLVES
jgi:hypothetical protein